MRRLFQILFGCILFIIVGLGGSALTLHYYILPSPTLRKQIVEYVNRETNIKIKCDDIKLNYIDAWPLVSIEFKDLQLDVPSQADSTVIAASAYIKYLSGQVQLMKFIKDKELHFNSITIDSTNIIISSENQFPSLLKTNNYSQFENPLLSIKKATLTGINISVSDSIKKSYSYLSDLSADLRIKKRDITTLEFNSFHSKISHQQADLLFPISADISWEGSCITKDDFNTLEFEGMKLLLNQFPLELDGILSNLQGEEKPKIDADFVLHASDLKELQEALPFEILQNKNDYILSGATSLAGHIDGYVAQGSIPSMSIKGSVKDGSLYRRGIKQGFETINLNLNLRYIDEQPDSCYLSFEDVKLRGLNSDFQLNGQINNLKESPFIFGELRGNIDFSRIGEEFIPADKMLLQGEIDSNLSFSFNLKDLMDLNFSRIWLDGIVSSNHVHIASPEKGVEAYISGLSGTVGYKKNQSDFIAQDEVLNGVFSLDSMRLIYGDDLFLNVSRLHLRSNTTLQTDSSSVTPLTTHADCKIFNLRYNDHQWLKADDLEVHGGYKPSLNPQKKLEGALVFRSHNIKYLDLESEDAFVMDDFDLIMEGNLSKNATDWQNLKSWEIKGMLNANQSKLYFSDFPQLIKASSFHMGFQNNLLLLNKINAQIGDSDISISGRIDTKRDSISNKSQIRGSLTIFSDNLNYNELKQIYLYSEAQNNSSQNDEVTIDNMEEHLMNDKNHVSVEEHPIYIPNTIQMNVSVMANNLQIDEMVMQDVNWSINLLGGQAASKMNARTNMGTAAIEMLYNPKDKQHVKAVVDVNLRSVIVSQINNVIPTIGVMFPMIKTMDGVIDCKLSMESEVSNQMEPILSTATAVCSLKGQNLVLFDNQTYKTIADKLMFKNKEQNVIDYISADLILQNNQVEVLPFMLEWDRYVAVVGGTQTTNFDYNLHLDLIKSPVPIKFGLDVTGKEDNLSYKTTLRRKYKDIYQNGRVIYDQSSIDKLTTTKNLLISHLQLN